jgi:hypothetical protein
MSGESKHYQPSRHLKKLDDRAAIGYLLGFKYGGAYRVWIRETRDITFDEDGLPAPMMHDEVAWEVQGGDCLVPANTSNLTPATTTAEGGVSEVGLNKEKITIWTQAVSIHAGSRHAGKRRR